MTLLDWIVAIYVAPYFAAMVVCVVVQSVYGSGDKD